MVITLDLPPEVLEHLTQTAIAQGLSLEDHTAQILKASISEPSSASKLSNHRQTWIEQRRHDRQAILTKGSDLSQTILESRQEECD
jgi:hypothetical protein